MRGQGAAGYMARATSTTEASVSVASVVELQTREERFRYRRGVVRGQAVVRVELRREAGQVERIAVAVGDGAEDDERHVLRRGFARDRGALLVLDQRHVGLCAGGAAGPEDRAVGRLVGI